MWQNCTHTHTVLLIFCKIIWAWFIIDTNINFKNCIIKNKFIVNLCKLCMFRLLLNLLSVLCICITVLLNCYCVKPKTVSVTVNVCVRLAMLILIVLPSFMCSHVYMYSQVYTLSHWQWHCSNNSVTQYILFFFHSRSQKTTHTTFFLLRFWFCVGKGSLCKSLKVCQ